jgi:hypothetical protein
MARWPHTSSACVGAYLNDLDVKREGSLTSFETNLRVVRPERFELPAYSFGGCRSIQLSYGRTWGASAISIYQSHAVSHRGHVS